MYASYVYARIYGYARVCACMRAYIHVIVSLSLFLSFSRPLCSLARWLTHFYLFFVLSLSRSFRLPFSDGHVEENWFQENRATAPYQQQPRGTKALTPSRISLTSYACICYICAVWRNRDIN